MRQMTFENIVGKGENTGNQYFLLFPLGFLPFTRQISILSSANPFNLGKCKILSFGKGFIKRLIGDRRLDKEMFRQYMSQYCILYFQKVIPTFHLVTFNAYVRPLVPLKHSRSFNLSAVASFPSRTSSSTNLSKSLKYSDSATLVAMIIRPPVNWKYMYRLSNHSLSPPFCKEKK